MAGTEEFHPFVSNNYRKTLLSRAVYVCVCVCVRERELDTFRDMWFWEVNEMNHFETFCILVSCFSGKCLAARYVHYLFLCVIKLWINCKISLSMGSYLYPSDIYESLCMWVSCMCLILHGFFWPLSKPVPDSLLSLYLFVSSDFVHTCLCLISVFRLSSC